MVHSLSCNRFRTASSPTQCCNRWHRYRGEQVSPPSSQPYPRVINFACDCDSRHGHVIIGGKGLNGQALGDAWVSAHAHNVNRQHLRGHCRNTILSINSGHRSKSHPVVLLLAGVRLAAPIHAHCQFQTRLCRVRIIHSIWQADSTARRRFRYQTHGYSGWLVYWEQIIPIVRSLAGPM